MPQGKLADFAKLYYTATPVTSTTYTLPATTVDNIKDAKISAKVDTPEGTTRASGGIKTYDAGEFDFGISFTIKVPKAGVTDAAYAALKAAWLTRAEIACFALDSVKTDEGADGPGGNWIVADMGRDEKLGEDLWRTVELKPSSFNAWYTVPAA